MNQKQLADHYGISKAAVSRWSAQKRHRKAVEALAGYNPATGAVVAELQRLAYLYNCQQWRGERIVGMCYVSVTNMIANIALFDMTNPSMDPFESHNAELDNQEQLNQLLVTMEQLVYGK
ncbi:MAG: LacI-type transcriptional regulator [Podoviridae sp. ctKoA10]|nr:MAG: LacI-type transcriptional regulator [Podoviridae sp. ctKoA10]